MQRPWKLIIGGALVLTPLWISCGKAAPDEQRAEVKESLKEAEQKLDQGSATMEEERQDVLKELRSLRDDINKRLEEENDKLASPNLKAEERADCEAMKEELGKERKIVDDAIRDVETADTSTWEEMKLRTRNTMDDVKKWWAKLKENVDRGTNTDNDKDGH